jgi:DNA-binding transcriptional regulator YiaG
VRAITYVLANNESELRRQQHAAIQYAQARGWPKQPSEDWATVASKPGEHLKDVLSMLSPGDVLLIANVSSLAERPSEQERIVRQLIGGGIRLHTIELGDINAHLPGLFAAWASAASVEQELDSALADMAQMEARHEQDMKDFESDLTSRILQEGVSITVGRANGHGNGAADHSLGDAIKHARVRKNLSQRQLAERCDISHTEVQRIEQLGYGKNIEQVMAVLGMEGKAGGLLGTPAPEALDVD